MRTAEITFKLPTTRVNSASLAESEIAQVAVYDNAYGDDFGESERHAARDDAPRGDRDERRDRVTYERDRDAQPAAPREDRDLHRDKNDERDRDVGKDDNRTPVGAFDKVTRDVSGPSVVKGAPEGRPNEGTEKQAGRQRRRKIGEWKGPTEGGVGVFKTTEELAPGVHYFQLVAIDTGGLSADPSPAFRVNISEEGDVGAPEKSDEPSLVNNVWSTGTDKNRPSMVTQVEVRLV